MPTLTKQMLEDWTLNDILTELGYTTQAAGAGFRMYCKHILKDGKVVFTGDAFDVLDWIKKEHYKGTK